MNASALIADHLDSQTDTIIALWRATVYQEGDVPESASLTYREFLDHVPELLDRLAERLRGGGRGEADAEGRAHGRLRWRQGYDIGQVVREELQGVRQAQRRFERGDRLGRPAAKGLDPPKGCE